MSDGQDSNDTARNAQRRTILKACCAFALASGAVGARADDGDEASGPPQAGDVIVFAFGKRAGQPIAPGDLKVGSKQVLAFPMNPASNVVRSARLNQLAVVRLDPAHLTAETLARAADGVVAYSGVCSHTGCDVTDWFDDKLHFKCPCHESEFDPADAARVISGPAPWQLAALPLKLDGDKITVAGPFVGRLGFAQPAGGPSGP